MKDRNAFFVFVVIFLSVFLFFPRLSRSAQQQGSVIKFSASQWQSYQNEQQRYSLRLPPELKTNYTRQRDIEEAAHNLLPFDYVNFGPKQPVEDKEPFELGIGVHWNKYNMTSRGFADLKDVGVKEGVRQYVAIRSSVVTVAGIKGVRDDFTLEREYGWTTYSRVLIPFQDKFFCFLCTLGNDKAVVQYDQVFQKIIDSFEIKK